MLDKVMNHEIKYQRREIGESDWEDCSFEQYQTSMKSPHMDTRIWGIDANESTDHNPPTPEQYVNHLLLYAHQIPMDDKTKELLVGQFDKAIKEHTQHITKVLGWLVSDIRETAREQKIVGAELYQRPCYGIGLHAWEKAVEILGVKQYDRRSRVRGEKENV